MHMSSNKNPPQVRLNREAVLQAVTDALIEVVGQEWAAELSISEETTFSEDLELESIELVALSEALQERFGQEVNFVAWISSLDLDAILALSVGDVVAYIHGQA